MLGAQLELVGEAPVNAHRLGRSSPGQSSYTHRAGPWPAKAAYRTQNQACSCSGALGFREAGPYLLSLRRAPHTVLGEFTPCSLGRALDSLSGNRLWFALASYLRNVMQKSHLGLFRGGIIASGVLCPFTEAPFCFLMPGRRPNKAWVEGVLVFSSPTEGPKGPADGECHFSQWAAGGARRPCDVGTASAGCRLQSHQPGLGSSGESAPAA